MIKINDNWFYEIEDNQYVLFHKFLKPKFIFGKNNVPSGEVVERTEECGYFVSISYMLRRVAQFMCREKAVAGEITTLKEHLAEFDRLLGELKVLVGESNEE